jgi:hypothetical protein
VHPEGADAEGADQTAVEGQQRRFAPLRHHRIAFAAQPWIAAVGMQRPAHRVHGGAALVGGSQARMQADGGVAHHKGVREPPQELCGVVPHPADMAALHQEGAEFADVVGVAGLDMVEIGHRRRVPPARGAVKPAKVASFPYPVVRAILPTR